ncbi:MAG: T9SS type A sorting domain-containing protein [Bacteroidales bacterium]|nr:T9SS type A sorting domain-containing protein [Bacteroidales bacterium]
MKTIAALQQNFIITLCTSTIISLTALGQTEQYIYMDNGKFYEGCEQYYPKTSNYAVIMIEDLTNTFHVSPYNQYCYSSNYCSANAWDYSCGTDVNAWQDQLITHLQKIDSLGFNSVRIMGLPVMVDEDENARTVRYYVQEQVQCLVRQDVGLELNPDSYEIMGAMMQEIIDVIRNNNINLKLVICLGQHGIEHQTQAYSDYLEYIGNRFKEEPIIFAWDLYNEPRYSKFPSPGSFETDKVEIADMVYNWYWSLKDNDPNHLITFGSVFADVQDWDPNLLTVDFLSYHVYSNRWEATNWELTPALYKYNGCLKYINETIVNNWILGETGLPGSDNPGIHPIVGSEADQAIFAIETFKYSNWYGSQGYSWWTYKEYNWAPDDTPGAKEDYFGIVYRLNDLQEHKLIGDEIVSLIPQGDCPECVDPPGNIYYDPYQYGFYEHSGYVYDINSNPLKNALIFGAKQVIYDDFKYKVAYPFYTFTDENGYFKVYASAAVGNEIDYYWWVSYSGMKTSNIVWDPQVYTHEYYLESIPTSSLPPPLVYNNELIINEGQSVTWDHAMVPYETSIIIKGGAKLSIKDMVYLKPGAKITVENGGELEVDGGVLSGHCLWEGVEVWGNSNSPLSEDQGLVVLKNGAVIENSLNGIYAARPGPFPWYANYYGGIIKAFDAEFINNRVSLKIPEYKYENRSVFKNCLFEINENNLFQGEFENMVLLSSVKGVDFVSCDFLNSLSNYCGIGIKVVNSSFSVLGECYEQDPSGDCLSWDGGEGEFHNLHYGIYTTGIGFLDPVQIKHTKFMNNLNGCYISAMDNVTIQYNKFETHNSIIGGYGLYLDECTAFTVDSNDFYQGTASGIGMVINNSGPESNRIYLNYFEEMNYAIIAQNENRALDGTGLVLKCNEYIGNTFDQVVTWKEPFLTGYAGIAAAQGANLATPDAPAGNQFSQTGSTAFSDFYNEANDVTYYYHDGYPFEPLIPQYRSESVTIEPVFAQWNDDSCPPSDQGSGGGLGDTEEMKSLITLSGQKADSVIAIIQILKDGGSTEALKWEVDMSTPPETYTVYNELMNHSPYISDTVMGSAIEKEEVLPNVMIRDVMVANPHNAKDESLLEKIGERSDPMPEYMIAQILQGQSLVSAFESLQSQKAYYKQQRSLALNALIKLYLSDTLDPAASKDSLKVLLENENSKGAKYRLAFLSMEQGAWSMGQQVLNEIPQQFNLSEEELAIHQQYTAFYNLLSGLLQQGKSVSEVDSTQIELLLNIEAMQAGKPSVYARNVLLALEQIEYEEPILLPDLFKSTAVQEERQRIMQSLDEHHYVSLFPNPAGAYLIIEHKLEMESQKVVVKINNMKGECIKQVELTGKQNQQTVDIHSLKPGIYTATIVADQQELETVKFTKK